MRPMAFLDPCAFLVTIKIELPVILGHCQISNYGAARVTKMCV